MHSTPINRRLRAASAAAALALTAGLALAPSAGATIDAKPKSKATVKIRTFRFRPGTTKVAVGATVTWKNLDDIRHTVTGDDDGSPIDGVESSKGSKYSVTFTEAGTYAYHCSIHTSMTGRVVVGP